MSVSASISSQSATQVLLLALYSSDPLESGAAAGTGAPAAGFLGSQMISLTNATSQSASLNVDLSQCLASVNLRGNQTCPYVYIEAFLLTGQNTYDPNNPAGPISNPKNVLDVDLVGPFSVAVNGTATTPRAVVLHEVGAVVVSPTFVSLATGQTQSVTASVVNIYGDTISGRTVTWTSQNTSVATVSATGQVTAVAPGSTTITAASGGRTSVVSVTVASPRIIASPSGTLSFTLSRFRLPVLTPGSINVSLTSSAGAAGQIALATPSVSYVNSTVSWLSASANTSATPATLNVLPSITANLADGSYSATITIRSTNPAVAAISVPVSLTVTSSSASITIPSGAP